MNLSKDESWKQDFGDDFTVEVSIVFLKFKSDASKIEVTIERDDEHTSKQHTTVYPNIDLPPDKNETHYKESRIIRSFSQVH